MELTRVLVSCQESGSTLWWLEWLKTEVRKSDRLSEQQYVSSWSFFNNKQLLWCNKNVFFLSFYCRSIILIRERVDYTGSLWKIYLVKIEHNNACIMRFIMFCFLPHSYLNRIYKCQGHDDISSITALVGSVSVIKPTARMALMKNKPLLLSTSVIVPCRENEVTFMSFYVVLRLRSRAVSSCFLSQLQCSTLCL